jgi:hypothetical protein
MADVTALADGAMNLRAELKHFRSIHPEEIRYQQSSNVVLNDNSAPDFTGP